MAFVAGHTSTVQYDNSAGSLQNLSAYIDNISGFDLTRQTYDVTSMADTASAYILGLKGGQSITISGSWDSTLHTHMIGVDNLTTNASQTLRYSPAGTSSGKPYVEVETFLTTYSHPSAVGNKVTWSATLQATGNVTHGTN